MISNAVEHSRGANASLLVNGSVDPPSFLAGSFKDVEQTYERLATQEARRSFFESGMTRIDRNLPGSWARLYWFLDLCRREQWFWKEKGYSSFEDYWEEQGKFAFTEIGKLETMFHFAKTACPELFDLSQKEAEFLWNSLARRSTTNLRRANGRKPKGAADLLFPELDYDSQSDEFQRGYQSNCGRSAIRRFRQLKKSHPTIAKEVLEGKFVRTVKGKTYPDLAAAEKKAGTYKPRTKTTKSERVAGKLTGLSSADLDALWEALDGPAKRRLRSLTKRR